MFRSDRRRERFLAIYGPLSLLGLSTVWALGLVSSYTMGGFIHILLVVAVVVVLVSLITGRRPSSV